MSHQPSAYFQGKLHLSPLQPLIRDDFENINKPKYWKKEGKKFTKMVKAYKNESFSLLRPFAMGTMNHSSRR